MKHASKAFSRGVLVSIVGAVLVGVLNYLTRRVLLLRLDQSAYGFFYGAVTLVSLVATLPGAGFGQATAVLVSKYMALRDERRGWASFGFAFITRSLIAAAVAALLLVLGPWLLRTYYGPEGAFAFTCLAWFAVLSAMLGSVTSVMQGLRYFGWLNGVYACQYGLLLLVCLLWTGKYGLNAAAVGLVVAHAAAVGMGLGWIRARHNMRGFGRFIRGDVAAEVWRVGRWLFVLNAGLCIMSGLDTLMLTHFRGVQAVAVYHVALPVMQIFMVIAVVPGVMTPIASDLWHRGRPEAIGDLCRLTMRVMLILLWTLAIGLVPSAGTAVRILFGPGLEAAALPLLVLGTGVPVLVMGQFSMNVLSAIERPRDVGVMTVIAVIANVALNVFLIRSFGTVGAALATVCAYGILLAMGLWRLRRFIDVPLLRRDDLPVVLAGAVVTVIVVVVNPVVAGPVGKIALSLGAVLVFWTAVRRDLGAAVRDLVAALRGGQDPEQGRPAASADSTGSP